MQHNNTFTHVVQRLAVPGLRVNELLEDLEFSEGDGDLFRLRAQDVEVRELLRDTVTYCLFNSGRHSAPEVWSVLRRRLVDRPQVWQGILRIKIVRQPNMRVRYDLSITRDQAHGLQRACKVDKENRDRLREEERRTVFVHISLDGGSKNGGLINNGRILSKVQMCRVSILNYQGL